MRVERFVERADEKNADVGWLAGHENETSGSMLDYNPSSRLGGEHRLLIAELQVVQPAIEPAGAEQLVVRAPLHHPSRVEHHDLVRVAHGGQTVRDHQHGPLGHEPVDRLLHQPLRLGVQRAGGLVEDQDGRVAEQRPGDRDPLPLAAREPGPALAEQRVVALRQLRDERSALAARAAASTCAGVAPGEP